MKHTGIGCYTGGGQDLPAGPSPGKIVCRRPRAAPLLLGLDSHIVIHTQRPVCNMHSLENSPASASKRQVQQAQSPEWPASKLDSSVSCISVLLAAAVHTYQWHSISPT